MLSIGATGEPRIVIQTSCPNAGSLFIGQRASPLRIFLNRVPARGSRCRILWGTLQLQSSGRRERRICWDVVRLSTFWKRAEMKHSRAPPKAASGDYAYRRAINVSPLPLGPAGYGGSDSRDPPKESGVAPEALGIVCGTNSYADIIQAHH